MMTEQPSYDVMFRPDNTDGYSELELEELNRELAVLLHGLEQGSPEYYEQAKFFHDQVSRR